MRTARTGRPLADVPPTRLGARKASAAFDLFRKDLGLRSERVAGSRRRELDPVDPEAAINAQAQLMRELLGRFGSVPLALAAYNAGPGAVDACGCIPAYPETRAYVAKILGLLGGAGDVAAGVLEVRLVE